MMKRMINRVCVGEVDYHGGRHAPNQGTDHESWVRLFSGSVVPTLGKPGFKA
jgi:hypothetical protein